MQPGTFPYIVKQFEKMLSHIILQNARNEAKLEILLNAAAQANAEKNDTDVAEELALLSKAVSESMHRYLGEALDAINDVPKIE